MTEYIFDPVHAFFLGSIKNKKKKVYGNTEDDRRASQLNTIRLRAEKAGIPFAITKKDLDWPTHCPILGIELSRGGDRNTSPSVDRINPDLGYIKGNVRVISKLANTMKSNATVEQLEMFCKNIGPYLNGDI